MKFNNLLKNVPIHETLRIGILLAFVGGFLDAYTYLLWGGVFANAQTGNIVLMAISIANGNFYRVLLYIIPISAYFVGVFLTEAVKNRFKGVYLIEWQHIVIIIEIVLLFIIGFLPEDFAKIAVTTTISFICSLQTSTFRKSRGLPYATTMCTGNLRSAGEHFYKACLTRSSAEVEAFLRYISIIAAFAGGAAIGVFIIGVLAIKSIWICCVILAVILAVMFFGR